MSSDPKSDLLQREPAASDELLRCMRIHLRVGWWSLLCFVALGFVLETLHGFKIDWYLDPAYETRRLMWRLAHAHGTLLSLVNVAFAITIRHAPHWNNRIRQLSSRFLVASAALIPIGFFLGGVRFYAGDPGLGILLVPAGAVTLFTSVLLLAIGLRSIEL